MEITPFTNLTVTFSKNSFCVSGRTERGAQMSLANGATCQTQTTVQCLHSIREADGARKWWCTAVSHKYSDTCGSTSWVGPELHS